VAQRDDRIDFLRGFALLAIFIDHVPQNPLSLVTPHAFAYCDAAEMFFFISGLTAAHVYMRRMREQGFLAGTARIWERARKIYAAQFILLALLVAEVAAFVAMTGRSESFAMFRLDSLFTQMDASIVPLVLLNYQPAYLDILPVYFLFFLALPWVLTAAEKNAWFVVAPSFLLYAAAHILGWTLRTYPWNEAWMFNPFAWQFLFVLGVACGSWRMRKSLPNWLSFGAMGIAGVIAVLQFSVALHDFFPAVPALKIDIFASNKADLGWPRLFSFFLLVIVAAKVLPQRGVLDGLRPFRYVTGCGRHSLMIFGLGTVLAAIGPLVWEVAGHSRFVQAGLGIVGLAILLAFGRLLDWFKAVERPAKRPAEREAERELGVASV
jgi:hypothetical protein